MVKTVTLTSMQLLVMFTKKKAKTGSKSVILEDHKVLKGIKVKMESKDHKVFKDAMDKPEPKDQRDATGVMELQDVTEETDAMEKMY